MVTLSPPQRNAVRRMASGRGNRRAAIGERRVASCEWRVAIICRCLSPLGPRATGPQFFADDRVDRGSTRPVRKIKEAKRHAGQWPAVPGADNRQHMPLAARRSPPVFRPSPLLNFSTASQSVFHHADAATFRHFPRSTHANPPVNPPPSCESGEEPIHDLCDWLGAPTSPIGGGFVLRLH